MPQSIYDNGGMIGATLNVRDDTIYELNPFVTDIEFIGATPVGTVYAGGNSLPIPNSGNLLPGDFVALFVASDSGTPSIPSGFTEVVNAVGGFSGISYALFYKFMGDTPDTQVDIEDTGSSMAAAIAVFRGVSQTDTIEFMPDRTISAGFSGGGMPETPAIIGEITEPSLILQIGFLDDDNVASSVGSPSGYTLTTATEADTAGATVMVAHKITTAPQTDEPAQSFTGSGDDVWVGLSLVINRGSGFTPGNQKNSGIWSTSSVFNSYANDFAEFEFITSSVGTTSVVIPSEAQDGDIGIFLEYGNHPQSITPIVPTGFQNITFGGTNTGTGNTRLVVNYKILSISDANTTVTGTSYDTANGKIFLIFRTNSAVSSLYRENVELSSSTSVPSDESLIKSEQSGLMLFMKGVYAIASGPTINVSGETVIAQVNSPIDNTGRLGVAITKYGQNYYWLDESQVVVSSADDGEAQLILAVELVAPKL